MVPAPAGGPTDIVGRLIGQMLVEPVGQQLIIENRGGAGNMIGTGVIAQAKPDGYSLVVGSPSALSISPNLYKSVPYHPVNDFTPISQLTRAGLILVVNPSSPPKNLKEFIDWTKNFKGPLNFGSAGAGSGGHLAGELFNLAVKIKAQHIPYKGSAPSLIDLVAGQYHYNFVGMSAAQALVKSGKLRALAVTTPKRLKSQPDIPAVAEVLPGFEVVGWYGVMGPAQLSKVVLAKLHAEIVTYVKSPDFIKRASADGAEPVGSDPESFRQFMLDDVKKWAEVVKRSGAKFY